MKIKPQTKLKIISLVTVVLLIAAGITMRYFSPTREHSEPKRLVAKFTFGKEGKGLGEFFGLSALAIKDNFLYAADTGNARIQVLEIKY